ncbi:MAG TPA: inorganic diphosphatase [Saprospiraceae bacterium]|nr:inorganic diphosphatase [Saprospiraceae bacterium]
MRILFLFSLPFLLWQCQGRSDLTQLSAFGETGINAVIEIPAGSNHKIEYDKSSLEFKVDQIDGQDRIIDFLPYPANYGFIPSTEMDLARGGDGDALDVLVLCESLATGTILETKIIAALLLRDQQEIDTKIIAIPADPQLRVFDIDNFQDFLLRQDAAKRIIENWFLHYKGANQVELIRWEDDQYALQEIEKWKK